MFLMIHESGHVDLVENLTDADYSAADDGYIDLINIGPCEKPLRYFADGKWEEIKKAANEG